jgi:hypothetical protein
LKILGWNLFNGVTNLSDCIVLNGKVVMINELEGRGSGDGLN